MNVLDHARKYLANGWSVIPIPHKQKFPDIPWGEYRERYATDDELVKWFSDRRNGVGIVTGQLSNLSVLDADGNKGLDLLAQYDLFSIGTVITGGGGRQLFYRFTGETNKWESGKNHEGLDARGEGGLIVAPPTVHASGRTYQWSNGIPNPALLQEFPKGLFTPKPIAQGSAITLPPPQPEIVEALKGVPAGEPRHGKLVKILTYLIPRHSLEVVRFMVKEWNSRNAEPYPAEEIEKQILDIAKRYSSGQYKSTFVPKVEVAPNEPIVEEYEVGNPNADGDEYLADALNPKHAGTPELPTGYPSLDEATYGFQRGAIVCIGARPGAGKTSFITNALAGLCRTGKRVLYFSTELTKPELYNKFAASQGGVKAFNLKHKCLDQHDRDALVAFLPELKKYNFHAVKAFKPTERIVREAVEKHDPDILVIDHLQHIAEGDKRYAEIDKFVKFLKRLALEKNIAVIVASQLKRREDGEMPSMSDLKECGTIEEESSIVILLHNESKEPIRPILFRITKNRDGRMGDTTLQFDGVYTKFTDMAVPVQ